MTHWLDKAAVLGKAPWRAEFLRASGRSNELRSFDEWLFRNGSALTHSPREPGHVSHGFVLCLAPADRPLHGIAGVLGPSCDSAGRSYPLSIAAPVAFDAEAGAHPEVAPIVLESYWDLAIDVLTAARSAPPPAGAGALDELTERPAESTAGALGMYRDWLRRTTVGELCALLERPPAWLDRALLAISDDVAPPAVAEGSSRPRSIRLPLGEAGGSALCVWLDVARRAAGRSARVPSFFWSHDGRLGDALLFLDTPSESTLATLWRLDADARDVRDLTLPTACPEVMGLDPVAVVAGAEADTYGALGKQTLWHLLDRIEARAPASR